MSKKKKIEKKNSDYHNNSLTVSNETLPVPVCVHCGTSAQAFLSYVHLKVSEVH